MHKIIYCASCEAEFNLRHSMDDVHYVVEYCPFCGEMLEDDIEYEFDIEDDEDDS